LLDIGGGDRRGVERVGRTGRGVSWVAEAKAAAFFGADGFRGTYCPNL
jgi:hypothetical protein